MISDIVWHYYISVCSVFNVSRERSGTPFPHLKFLTHWRSHTSNWSSQAFPDERSNTDFFLFYTLTTVCALYKFCIVLLVTEADCSSTCIRQKVCCCHWKCFFIMFTRFLFHKRYNYQRCRLPNAYLTVHS